MRVPRDDRAHQAEEQVMIKRLRSYVIEKIALQVYDSEAVMERLREVQDGGRSLLNCVTNHFMYLIRIKKNG